jgi:hypothetical protein
MKLILRIEVLRFYLHWLVLILVCGPLGALFGWEAGLGFGSIAAGILNVLLLLSEFCLPATLRENVTEKLNRIITTGLGVRLKETGKMQFFSTVVILALAGFLAVLDPLFSRMFLAHIILGSLLIVGALCSALLMITGIIAVVKYLRQS